MRFEQLLEAKNVYDHRHENISDIIKPWAGGDKYIDPRDGFYWIFSKGNLFFCCAILINVWRGFETTMRQRPKPHPGINYCLPGRELANLVTPPQQHQWDFPVHE